LWKDLRGDMFQSPSLRGSGRFAAVVYKERRNRVLFQSPSLRGSGRFGRVRAHDDLLADVSIPFIAGQWSLRAESAEDVDILLACFNPLHCGAVVASPAWRCSASSPPGVSIPFIAGQWSLQTWKRFFSAARRLFQSPSLRGSGRFFRSGERTRARRTPRFNPLHCGAVVASWTI